MSQTDKSGNEMADRQSYLRKEQGMTRQLITGLTHLGKAALFGLLAAILPAAAEAAVATVGTGGGCTHTNLASAVAAVEAGTGEPHAIFIVEEIFPSVADVTITQSMTIWGGLPTCRSRL